MGGHGHARLALVVSCAVCACCMSMSAAPSATPDLETLLTKVGARIADYYRRAQSVICTEQSTVQPIATNWALEGFARTVESDLRVDSDAADGDTLPEPTVIRDVRRVNGRAPRERDKKDRTGCTDPNPLSPEPLAFLLPAHRSDFRFTAIHEGREKDRAALVIDFMTANRKSKPQLIEDERGHDDCFDWSGPVATRGRVWVDAATNEVLRVDRHTEGPVDIQVPWNLQRRHNLPAWIVLEHDDVTMRYKAVTFSDPDEVLVLPESIESLTVLRNSLQSVRRTHTFSSYRRFLTGGRIIRDR